MLMAAIHSKILQLANPHVKSGNLKCKFDSDIKNQTNKTLNHETFTLNFSKPFTLVYFGFLSTCFLQ